MSRGSQIRRRIFPKVEDIARILSKCYGDHAHNNKVNPLNELLFIICSVQTNKTLYQSTYASLKARFPTFRQLADAAEDEIASIIAHGGLARQKARNICAILSRLQVDFGTPSLSPLRGMGDAECEDYLVSLPGVGRKTARCVMMYSLGRNVFPVDSNIWRILRRLGWIRATRPDKSCSPRDMDRVQAGIPPDLRFSLHVNLVSHGRACCLPTAMLCDQCSIWKFCKMGKRHKVSHANGSQKGQRSRIFRSSRAAGSSIRPCLGSSQVEYILHK
jgi:endonuclease III